MSGKIILSKLIEAFFRCIHLSGTFTGIINN